MSLPSRVPDQHKTMNAESSTEADGRRTPSASDQHSAVRLLETLRGIAEHRPDMSFREIGDMARTAIEDAQLQAALLDQYRMEARRYWLIRMGAGGLIATDSNRSYVGDALDRRVDEEL